jgi:hypothetical protein
MKPNAHILISSILALILYPFFSWNVLFIFIGGVMIDIDHYFWYTLKHKKFSLSNCYKFYMDRSEISRIHENDGILLILHTIEFLIVTVILSLYYEFALLFLVGLVSHYILDLIFLYSIPKSLIADHSLVHWLLKQKRT